MEGIKDFKVIEKKILFEREFYTYQFTFSEVVYYSNFSINPQQWCLINSFQYWQDPESEILAGRFSKEVYKEIVNKILNQPAIRLRHLLMPYDMVDIESLSSSDF